MRKSKKFVSLPVVSTKEGKEIGKVKKLVIDPSSRKVTAFVVERKKGLDDGILLYQDLKSVGNEAITVDLETKVMDVGFHTEILAILKAEINLVGSKILIENGSLLGTIQDYWIDKNSGDILFLDFSTGFFKDLFRGVGRLDIKHVKTLGKEIVIANEGIEKEIIETSTFRFKK